MRKEGQAPKIDLDTENKQKKNPIHKEEKRLNTQRSKRKNMAYNKNQLYKDLLIKHYSNIWGKKFRERTWDRGPMKGLSSDFSILEFEPSLNRNMWTYSTCGMSTFTHIRPIELHVFSSIQDDSILELLTSVSYYHNVDDNLDLGHTVNFGRSWQDSSTCSYGLISLPYLDGPDLEIFNPSKEGLKIVHCYWLIPITEAELEFKKQFGLETLEERFDETQFNYVNPQRESVV
ncbi:MAG TPA: suppressor of fused domain protein [Mucilaginibacter sp.]